LHRTWKKGGECLKKNKPKKCEGEHPSDPYYSRTRGPRLNKEGATRIGRKFCPGGLKETCPPEVTRRKKCAGQRNGPGRQQR